MKLVVQFFNEKNGTRSEAFTGSPTELLDILDKLEETLRGETDRKDDLVSMLDPDDPEQVYEGSHDNFAAAAYSARDAAYDNFLSFLESFVIVILEQHSDDAGDMRVSRIPILKRESFIDVLKKKSQG